MEVLVSTNIIRPPSLKNNLSQNDVLVPYRLQCAFIRIFAELYPEVRSLDLYQISIKYKSIISSDVNHTTS